MAGPQARPEPGEGLPDVYPAGMTTTPDPVTLRSMVVADVPAVLTVQEPGAVVALATVFPQDEFPFPRDAIADRWRAEIRTSDIDCLVVEQDHQLIGFAAMRSEELMHFGIAVERWGTGAAEQAHDALLVRAAAAGFTRAWLRVFTGNARARRFYERLGWEPTGERTRSAFPPCPELLRLERDLPRGRTVSPAARR